MPAPHSCVSSIWLILLSRRPGQQQQAADRGEITSLSAVQTKGPKRPLSVLLDIRQLHRLAASYISAPSSSKDCVNKLSAHFFRLEILLNSDREEAQPRPVTQKTGSLYERLLPVASRNSAPTIRRSSLTFAGETMPSLFRLFLPYIYVSVSDCRGNLIYLIQLEMEWFFPVCIWKKHWFPASKTQWQLQKNTQLRSHYGGLLSRRRRRHCIPCVR